MTIGASSSTPHRTRSSRPSSWERTGSSTSSKRTANSSTAGSSPGGSTIAAARRTRSDSVISSRSVGMRYGLPGKLDDAANPVLGVHEVEPLVDLVEREPVRDEGRYVDLAFERALDELRDLVAALDAAERGAADAPAGDQIARDDVERLALAGHAGDGAQAPAHARGLHGLAHDRDDPRRLEGVVGAEAAGLVEDPLDDVGAALPGLGGTLAAGEL